MRGNPKIAHQDWIGEAAKIVEDSFRLYRTTGLPSKIEGFMLVTPMRRALRAIYGSDLRAALALLWLAVAGACGRRMTSVKYRLWKAGLYRSEIWDELEAEDAELDQPDPSQPVV